MCCTCSNNIYCMDPGKAGFACVMSRYDYIYTYSIKSALQLLYIVCTSRPAHAPDGWAHTHTHKRTRHIWLWFVRIERACVEWFQSTQLKSMYVPDLCLFHTCNTLNKSYSIYTNIYIGRSLYQSVSDIKSALQLLYLADFCEFVS